MHKLLKYRAVSWALILSTSAGAAPAGQRSAVTIEHPDYQWVDAPGVWTRPEGGLGKGDIANDFGAGAGLSSGAGTAGKPSKDGTEFTQPGSKGAGAVAKPAENSGAQQGSSSTPGGQIEIHDYWWPVCAFMSPGVSQATANAAIKGMIEAANACKVNMVVWTKTVKAGTWNEDDPADVNSKAVKNCNLPPNLATAGSATSLVMPPLTAAKMCGATRPDGSWDPGVAGCAELRSGTDTKKFKPSQLEGEGKGGGAAGNVAASIEVPSGHDAGTLAHEIQGHSQFGQPNGSDHGNGIGGPGGGGGGGMWSAVGCATMRATALPNTRRFGFDPRRQDYYVIPRNPDAYYDMTNDPPIFGSADKVQLAGPVPPLLTPAGSTLAFDEGAKKQNTPDPKKPEDKKGAVVEDGDEKDIRHRKKNVVNVLLDNLKGEGKGSGPEDPTDSIARKPEEPPPSEGAKPSSRITFDESAPKGRVGSGGGGSAATSADAKPEDVYSGSTASASASAFAGEASPSQGPVAERTSSFVNGPPGAATSIAFDESAPKREAALDSGEPNAAEDPEPKRLRKRTLSAERAAIRRPLTPRTAPREPSAVNQVLRSQRTPASLR